MENPALPFIGRVSDLSEIQWSHIDNLMVVLTGSRGVGKSELAKKYVQDFAQDSSKLWINSESHLSVRDAFKELATTLGLSIENKDATTIIKEVIDHFKNRKTLFIFDNSEADNLIVNNLGVWIGNSKLIKVIVTSRNENWDEKKFRIVNIKPFTLEESTEFIKSTIAKEINLSVSDEDCKKLSEFLKFIPLALSDAVKEIIKKNSLNPGTPYTVTDFIESFNEKPVQPVPEPEAIPSNNEEVNESVKQRIEEEIKRSGDKIAEEAKRVATSVREEAKRFEKRVRKWFG